MSLKRIIFCVLFACVWVSPLLAGEDSWQDTIRNLERRIDILEKKVEEQNRYIIEQETQLKQQKEKITDYESELAFLKKIDTGNQGPVDPQIFQDIKLGAGSTLVIQGANNVNYNGDGHTLNDSRADASYSADITLEKEFKEQDARLFLHLEALDGQGLEDNLTLYSNVNRDAGSSDNRLEVTELWFEKGLFKDGLFLALGKLDPTAYFDQNEIANDETTQFLSRIFRNSPTIEFPDNSAGIHFSYLPLEWLQLSYGVFEGDGDWEEIGDNLFNIGQVTFKTNFFNLAGNYRFLGWNSKVYHTRWQDATSTKDSSYGFGLSFDQKIATAITIFLRYGWQNPKVYNPEIVALGDLNYSLEHSWSAGFQIEGSIWSRPKDVLGLAIGQAVPSRKYKRYTSQISQPKAKSEGHLEMYYRIYLNEHLAISPDFQYIWNAFGKDIDGAKENIFLGGMRAQLDF